MNSFKDNAMTTAREGVTAAATRISASDHSQINCDTHASKIFLEPICVVLRENLECQYGLMDHLIESQSLSSEEVADIMRGNLSSYERTDKLLARITRSNMDRFLTALRASNQGHLANYIAKSGENTEDSEDWPLGVYQKKSIQDSYVQLVNEMATKELLHEIYQYGCISYLQKASITNHRTPHESNVELLDIMMHRSIQQFNTFVDSLEKYNKHLGEKISTQICDSFTITIKSDETGFKKLGETICGITVLDTKIFVARHCTQIVDVYDSHNLTTLRSINIPDMNCSDVLTGCAYKKALYIGGLYIHRVDINNDSVTRWKMRENLWLCGFSVTAEHTLLVTVLNIDREAESSVMEYNSDGQLLREIFFEESITYATHVVQLSSDQFIVCESISLGRVCVVNTEGGIIKSYSGEAGGGEGQLNGPCSLAVDYSRNHIFLADTLNDRVLVLDTDLIYLGEAHIATDLKRPCYLCIDSSTNRLLVTELSGRLFIVSIPQITDYIKTF